MRKKNLGLAVYLTITFGLAWIIELWPVRLLGYGNGNLTVMLLMVGVMFTPALGAVAARLVEGSGFADAGLCWGRGRYHVIAWLLPFALGLAATGLTLALGAGELDLSGKVVIEKLPPAQQEAAVQQLLDVGPLAPLLILVGALTQGVLITSLATFGEEFGWRGYLQPRLEHLGPVTSVVFVGFTWGVWHAPIILQGHNYPGYPGPGALMMIVFCVLLSIIFGWLFRRSGSILSPTLAHASVNSPAMSLLAFVRGSNPLIGNLTGVIGLAVLAIVAGAVLIADKRDRKPLYPL
ncbi:MAG: CPBP family intramembrane glutamic endopeptidase [Armatimonadia bacterium]